MDKDHISKEQFLLEFFGMIGRELADPQQHFTDNPNDIFQFIENCRVNKKPAFISVNPREAHEKVSGIEKLFFDFDYADKTFVKKLAKRIKDPIKREAVYEKRKIDLRREVQFFLLKLSGKGIVPLVVKTRKGFHVYIFLDKVYTVTGNNEELLKETYYQLQRSFMMDKKGGYEYLDESVIGDLKRMCRIPTSIHEVSGEECYLVEKIDGDQIIPAKFRGLDNFRLSGLKDTDWLRAVGLAYDAIKKRELAVLKAKETKKENWEMEHGFVGDLRYCFLERIKSKEMSHKQRLALLLEGWYSGLKTEEQLINLFRSFNDFNYEKTKIQVKWFFNHKIYIQVRPYTCKKIEEENWCLKYRCPLWQKRSNALDAKK